MPVVLGPAAVPTVADDEEAARAPELALLWVLAHGDDERCAAVAAAAIAAVELVDVERAWLWRETPPLSNRRSEIY